MAELKDGVTAVLSLGPQRVQKADKAPAENQDYSVYW